MTLKRLRAYLVANVAIIAGGVTTGATVGEIAGPWWGLGAGILFAYSGMIALGVVLVWRALKREGFMKP